MSPRERIEQALKENAEALRQIPLPPGVAEWVAQMVAAGETEQILGLLKLSFLFGVQQGMIQHHPPAAPPVSGLRA